MRGVYVNIYRWDLGDCTHGGVTGGAPGARLWSIALFPVPGGNVNLSDELAAGRPVLYAQKGPGDNMIARPVSEAQSAERWWMFGGNYVIGDSRFSEAFGNRPIPVHDRCESSPK